MWSFPSANPLIALKVARTLVYYCFQLGFVGVTISDHVTVSESLFGITYQPTESMWWIMQFALRLPLLYITHYLLAAS